MIARRGLCFFRMRTFWEESGIRVIDDGVPSVSLTTTERAVAEALLKRGAERKGEFACHAVLCSDCFRGCQGKKQKKENKNLAQSRGEETRGERELFGGRKFGGGEETGVGGAREREVWGREEARGWERERGNLGKGRGGRLGTREREFGGVILCVILLCVGIVCRNY